MGRFKNVFISIPWVVVLTRSTGYVAAADGQNMMNFQASNVNLIDSMILDYGNNNIVQQNANINAYCVFQQHTEMSLNDVEINSHNGYRKDSNKWVFTEAGGMKNNDVANLTSPFKHHANGQELIMPND